MTALSGIGVSMASGDIENPLSNQWNDLKIKWTDSNNNKCESDGVEEVYSNEIMKEEIGSYIGIYKIVTLPGETDLCLCCNKSLGEGFVAVHSEGTERHPVHVRCLRERYNRLQSAFPPLEDNQGLFGSKGRSFLICTVCPHALHGRTPNCFELPRSLYQPVTSKGRVTKLTVDMLTHRHFKKILFHSSMLITCAYSSSFSAWLPLPLALGASSLVGFCVPVAVGIVAQRVWDNGKREMFGLAEDEGEQKCLPELVPTKVKKFLSTVADCMNFGWLLNFGPIHVDFSIRLVTK